MTMDEIKALIDAMGASDLAEMEVAKDGWTLRLVRHAPHSASLPFTPPPPAAPKPQGAPSARPAAVQANDVRAPLSGIVYLGPSSEAPPFVTVGESVEAGTLLCTVEAMKTFNEVRAERAGVIAAVLAASGDEVEAGQPLLRFG